MNQTRICPLCGKEFIPRPNQKYCSMACKSTRYYREQEERKMKLERLEKEADWLAKNCQGEDQCPYLALYRDIKGNVRPDWCNCLDNGEEFDCDEYAPDCWRKAAREAVEAQCKTD